MHTPYGATECLPVATIEAAEVLGETAAKTDAGAGVCVGRKFDSIEWRVVRISDEPIASIDEAEELPTGEIGELIVRGPQASPYYVTRPECNLGSKISSDAQDIDRETGRQGDKDTNSASGAPCLPYSLSPCPSATWHRMGDVGYLDDQCRFWYCGRKSQRVATRNGPLYTEPIEAMFNRLPGVRKSALVGVVAREFKHPVVVIEPIDSALAGNSSRARQRQSDAIESWYDVEPRLETLFYAEQGYIPLAAILFHPRLPVDVRHNAKINRELLAAWAAEKLPELA